MMGLGYLGSSSSSSASSNLSPLAPPFTVDRSNQNKAGVNSHLNDPSYGVPFTSSWPYSQSSIKKLGDSARTSSLPSNESGYMIESSGNWAGNVKHGLEQISPHWSAAYPSSKGATDCLSYNLSEAKPFYPPYASSVSNDDIGLVSIKEASYDLLSTCHGDETSQIDYTRSLSGLEYNPQKESVWSGKQVKKMESDDSFFSEEANLAASLAYNNYLNQGVGGYGTESSKKSKDDGSLFYYADIIRRANNTSAATTSTGNDLSKTFRAFPMFSESHPLIQSPEPPSEDVWNSQNSYNTYHMFDHKSLVIQPPVSKPLEIGNLNINDSDLSFQVGTTKQQDMNEQVKFEFKAKPPSVEEEVSIPKVEIRANSFETHNPAEDSPCWKGAVSQFLPFEADSKKLQTASPIVAVNGDNKSPTHSEMEAKNMNSSGLVKSLYNLSDLLLLHCSNDEFGLKEDDVEALDHVIRNLGICMSRRQSTHKLEEEVMSNKNASVRVQAKDDDMVQAIKKVLDDNLECKEEEELPSLYKNLWLEAEAELCSLSFRTRFERFKRETHTHKSKGDAIKEIDPPKPHIDDADVMARFNILKRRQDPIPVPQVTAVGKDIDPCVMDRFNILKRRGDDVEDKQDHFRDQEEEEEEEAVGSGGGSDWEHILKDDFSWRLSS